MISIGTDSAGRAAAVDVLLRSTVPLTGRHFPLGCHNRSTLADDAADTALCVSLLGMVGELADLENRHRRHTQAPAAEQRIASARECRVLYAIRWKRAWMTVGELHRRKQLVDIARTEAPPSFEITQPCWNIS